MHPQTYSSYLFRCRPLGGAFSLGLILIFLSGCELGPDFRSPAPPKMGNYGQKNLTAGKSPVSIGTTVVQRLNPGSDIPGQWWTLFHSETLNRLILEALRRNPSLEAAMASLRQSLENVAAGEGAYSPSVSANISSTEQYFNGAAFGVPALSSVFLLNTASVSISYPLDVFGGIRRQVESLKAQSDYQRFQLDAAYLTLTSNIVLTAILEASIREQIRATRTIIALEKKNLVIVRRQFSIGYASRSAVLTQKTTLAQEKATLPGLEKQLALEHHQMAVYLGRFPSEKIDNDFRLETLTLPKDLPLSLPSRLIEQRPDVRSAEAQLHSASALVGVATANMFPQISITGQYGSETLSSFLGPNSAFWSFGPSLTQPIFQGGSLLHKKRAAVAAFQMAKAQYRNTVLQAFQNVADTLRALQSDADTLEAQMEAEKAARESLQIANRQFHYGAIGYPNLYNAQQSYQQSLINLVQARANRYSDTVALFQSLGGGWWNLGKKDAPRGMKKQQGKS